MPYQLIYWGGMVALVVVVAALQVKLGTWREGNVSFWLAHFGLQPRRSESRWVQRWLVLPEQRQRWLVIAGMTCVIVISCLIGALILHALTGDYYWTLVIVLGMTSWVSRTYVLLRGRREQALGPDASSDATID